MSLLVSLNHASLIHAGVRILEDANWQIHRKQHFALIGRNGAGKSTLMRVLSRDLGLDEGAIHFQKGLVVSSLPQDLSISFGATVFEDIFNRVKAQGGLNVSVSLNHFTVTNHSIELDPSCFDEPILIQFVTELNELLKVMQLKGHESWESLSGGMKRRCALIAALLVHPDVLLLDEPTNHLDIQSIVWLEQYLKNFSGAVVFVTHDRIFLQNVATHIVALECGELKQYNEGYEVYLNQRAAEMAEEENETNRMKQRLLQEEHWLQRGVTARRKRNQGRLKALMDLRKNIAQRQKEIGLPGQWNPQVVRSGRVLMTAEHVDYAYANKVILKDFSFLMMRGDKIGIVGPNGCGKTTLAKILLGEITPTGGQVKFGATIEPIYFDQLQTQLQLDKSVMYNVADGAEYVELAEGKVHVAGYLKDFLFYPDQLQRSVNTLSGGEKQRLMLARCLALQGNFMVFDEPSNDLDLESLEQLANLLVQYTGTFILISHDRALIEDCVTRLLVWESPGVFREILPSQWQAQPIPESKPQAIENKVSKPVSSALSYAEQKELLKLPDEIAKIENKINELHHEMGDVNFYQQTPEKIALTQSKLENFEEKLQTLYERWEQLEQKQ
jgi:ATP-binding cassette subfamily F protein uup